MFHINSCRGGRSRSPGIFSFSPGGGLRPHQRALFFLVIAALFCGCAGPRTQLMEQVRSELAASDYRKAYATYKTKVGSTQRVDELLNLGLLAYEAGDYAASFAALAAAERLAEERQTKSVSREAAGIAVSDRVRAYQGTIFDKAMLHYYRALGFLAQDNLSSAAVEGRAIATYLEVNARESKHTYKDDAFLQWLSGALYHGYGQINDAWISYRRAREIYAAGFYGIPEPVFLCPLTLEAVREVGHSESEAALEAECPGAAAELQPDWGRVVMICETGTAPPIREENILLPVLKRDPHRWDNDDARDRYAWEVSQRRRGDYYYEQHELDYLLRIALPYYDNREPGTAVRQVVLRDAAGREYRAALMQDVGAILRQDLSDRQPAILARAISRALLKYAATKTAEKVGGKKNQLLGDLLGAAVNIAGAATEAADTRSWETLPDRIWVVDVQLPPGPHELRAVCLDDFGSALARLDFEPVNIHRGQTVFLRTRCAR